jgi:hypothetical protein
LRSERDRLCFNAYRSKLNAFLAALIPISTLNAFLSPLIPVSMLKAFLAALH